MCLSFVSREHKDSYTQHRIAFEPQRCFMVGTRRRERGAVYRIQFLTWSINNIVWYNAISILTQYSSQYHRQRAKARLLCWLIYLGYTRSQQTFPGYIRNIVCSRTTDCELILGYFYWMGFIDTPREIWDCIDTYIRLNEIKFWNSQRTADIHMWALCERCELIWRWGFSVTLISPITAQAAQAGEWRRETSGEKNSKWNSKRISQIFLLVLTTSPSDRKNVEKTLKIFFLLKNFCVTAAPVPRLLVGSRLCVFV